MYHLQYERHGEGDAMDIALRKATVVLASGGNRHNYLNVNCEKCSEIKLQVVLRTYSMKA